MTNPAFWIYPLFVIIAPLLLTAPLFPRAVRAVRQSIFTTCRRCCTLWMWSCLRPRQIFETTQIRHRIEHGPKQTSVGPNYCTRWYKYDSNADTWQPINHVPYSHALSYWKKINNAKRNRLVHQRYTVSTALKELQVITKAHSNLVASTKTTKTKYSTVIWDLKTFLFARCVIHY